MGKKTIDITIPTEPHEITVGQYLSVRKLNEDDPLYNIKVISILCDMEIDEVRGLPVEEFKSTNSIISQLFAKQTKFVQRFKIGDTEYGFIPNLDNMTLGEYIDIDTFVRDEQQIYKVMAILYRKITMDKQGLYQVEEYDSNTIDYEVMKDCPYDAMKEALVFFYNLGNELLNHIPIYLTERMVKSTRHKRTLEENGDGIVRSLDLLTRSLQELKKSHEKIYTRLLPS